MMAESKEADCIACHATAGHNRDAEETAEAKEE